MTAVMRTTQCLLWCALLAGCSDAAPSPSVAALSPEVLQLCERLDRLLAVWEQPRPAAADTAGAGPTASVFFPTDEHAPPMRTGGRDQVAELKQRIEALEHELAVWHTRHALQSAAAATAAGGATTPAVAVEPMRTNVVHQRILSLRAERQQQRNDLLRSMLLRAPVQVAQDLGMPTESYVTKNGSLMWDYRVGDDVMTLVFLHGQLVNIHP